MSDFSAPILYTLFGLGLVILLWSTLLFSKLKKYHPKMYKELGSRRSLSYSKTGALFKFLYSRRPESLGDSVLLMQSKFIRLIFFTYFMSILFLTIYALLKRT